MMSKRDYETIGSIVASILKAEGTHFVVCGQFATAFIKVNPAFNRSKFMKECGWNNEKPE